MSDPRNPDDWFDEPEPPSGPPLRPRAAPGETRPRRRRDVEDWVAETGAAPQAGRARALEARPLAVAVVVVLVILLLLAAAGVFSGSGSHHAPPTTATTSPATTPTTTQTSTAPVFAAPTTTLKPGDTGAQVKVLQQGLNHLGFPVGVADGTYGPATQRAVTAFQKAHGLTADGIVGPATLRALAAALGP